MYDAIQNRTPALVRAELVIHLDTGKLEILTHGPDGNGVPVWPGGRFDASEFAEAFR